jgi:SHS2 domain-containing protein
LHVSDKHDSYFDHDADIGVIGCGATVTAAFEAAATAMFAIMVDVEQIKPLCSVHVSLTEPDLELAFARWLNELLGAAQAEHLVLGRFELMREGDQWSGDAWGEPWRRGLERGVEVKGATLTMLRVRQTNGGWEARCVVDV